MNNHFALLTGKDNIKHLAAWDVDDYKRIVAVPADADVSDWALSNDGCKVAWMEYNKVCIAVLNPDKSWQETVHHTLKSERICVDLSFGCDSNILLAVASNLTDFENSQTCVEILLWDLHRNTTRFLEVPPCLKRLHPTYIGDSADVYAFPNLADTEVFVLQCCFSPEDVTGQTIWLYNNGHPDLGFLIKGYWPEWSPDGSKLLTWDETRIHIYDWKTYAHRNISRLDVGFSPCSWVPHFTTCLFVTNCTVLTWTDVCPGSFCEPKAYKWDLRTNDVCSLDLGQILFNHTLGAYNNLHSPTIVSQPKGSQCFFISSFPFELILEILGYLDFHSLWNVSQTCRLIRDMARDDTLYHALSVSPITGWGPTMLHVKPADMTWYEFYKRRFISINTNICLLKKNYGGPHSESMEIGYFPRSMLSLANTPTYNALIPYLFHNKL